MNSVSQQYSIIFLESENIAEIMRDVTKMESSRKKYRITEIQRNKDYHT